MNNIDVYEADHNGQDLRIAIVQSRFNEEHCQALTQACISELLSLGVAHQDIQLVTVPGALEIGFALSQIAKTEEFDAFIALGAVIRGETYHFELVANESASAITRISLDYGVPIANGILTCDTDEQAIVRADEKGRSCARAAIEMANLALAINPDLDDETE
jgi:6,7-dimethyl-8-ribityllumazine synthase